MDPLNYYVCRCPGPTPLKLLDRTPPTAVIGRHSGLWSLLTFFLNLTMHQCCLHQPIIYLIIILEALSYSWTFFLAPYVLSHSGYCNFIYLDCTSSSLLSSCAIPKNIGYHRSPCLPSELRIRQCSWSQYAASPTCVGVCIFDTIWLFRCNISNCACQTKFPNHVNCERKFPCCVTWIKQFLTKVSWLEEPRDLVYNETFGLTCAVRNMAPKTQMVTKL